MKRLVLLVSLLIAAPFLTFAQEPDAQDGATITSARVSGLDDDDLSPGLQRDINALAGTPLDWGHLLELAARIEEERPGTVAAVRAPRSSSDEARVLFVVGRDDHGQSRDVNVNERYTIERVAVDGIPETSLSQTLQDELHALVGTRLNRESRRLSRKLREELPDYDIDTRVARGSERGQVVLTFEVRQGERMRLIPFAPSANKFLYHEDQAWSGLLDLLIGNRNFRVTPRFAFDNRDDLVEEYSGGGVRFESRGVGTEHLGLSLEAAWYEPSWRSVTLAAIAANPGLPSAYDTRSTVSPMVTVGFPQRVRVSAGVSITELEALTIVAPSQRAGVFTASIDFDERWTRGDSSQNVDATLGVRSSAEGLGSDLDYTRVLGGARYRYRWDKHSTVIAKFSGGNIAGDAPLFERFTLGDSSTLRGWNKYDIAPAGGDAMVHGSLEYRYYGAAFFVDMGTLWDDAGSIIDPNPRPGSNGSVTPGSDAFVASGFSRTSGLLFSTGFGLHYDNFFATVGFPLNAESVDATFMIGVRF